MKKYFLPFFILLFFTHCATRQSVHEKRTFIDYNELEEGDFPIRESYSYLNTNIPGTDEPSTCFCDYRESIITFKEDATFVYTYQKGKKDILYYQKIEGTWAVDDRFLTVNILLEGNSFYEKNGLGQISYEEKSLPNIELIDGNIILDYDKELKSSGKIVGIIQKK